MPAQLEAVVTIDETDVSAEVHRFQIFPTRNLVTEEATYGDATEVDHAGAAKYTVQIRAKNLLAAASLARTLWTAFETDTAELDFEVQYQTGAVAADNPKWSGVLVVSEITIGTEVNGAMVLEQTFPAHSVVMSVAP